MKRLDLLMVFFSLHSISVSYHHLAILLLVLLYLLIFSLMSDLPFLGLYRCLFIWIEFRYIFLFLFSLIFLHPFILCLIFHFVWSKLDRVVYCYIWRLSGDMLLHISMFNFLTVVSCVLIVRFFMMFLFCDEKTKKKNNFPIVHSTIFIDFIWVRYQVLFKSWAESLK